MNHSDTTLAGMLREELTKAIALKTEGLIRDPQPREAGVIEGMQNALRMVDGAYSKLNDTRHDKQEK